MQKFLDMKAAPLFFRNGQGAVLYDQDGNAFTDYSLAGGTMIMGHAHRNVVLAVKKAAERGMYFGVATKSELDLGHEILHAFPRMERIRFTVSEEAALQDAVNLARVFTGKPLAVILGKRNNPSPPPPRKNEAGPRPQGENTQQITRMTYDNIEHVASILSPVKDRLACLVVSPLSIGHTVTIIPADDLKILRLWTRKNKILLIIDETRSGFRFHKGGLQETLDIKGDLTCLGGIIGGGFPLGAVGGRKDIWDTVPGLPPLITGDPGAANPVIMRAGLSTLRLLHPDVYQTLDRRASQLADRLNASWDEAGIPVRISRAGSMMKLYSQASDNAIPYPMLFDFLLTNNVLWPPDAREPFSLSAVHHPGDCNRLEFLLRNFFQKGS